MITHTIFAFEMAMAAKGLREGIRGNQSSHRRIAWGCWALANLLATVGLGVWAKRQIDKYRSLTDTGNHIQADQKG